jgi:hypothetical protein
LTRNVRVAVVASAQFFGGFQNLPPLQSLDFPAFFGLSHLFPPRPFYSHIFDTDLVTSQPTSISGQLSATALMEPAAAAVRNVISITSTPPAIKAFAVATASFASSSTTTGTIADVAKFSKILFIINTYFIRQNVGLHICQSFA